MGPAVACLMAWRRLERGLLEPDVRWMLDAHGSY